MENLTLVQLVGELKTLESHLKTINKRFENVSHQISSKIETAETLLEIEKLNNDYKRNLKANS